MTIWKSFKGVHARTMCMNGMGMSRQTACDVMQEPPATVQPGSLVNFESDSFQRSSYRQGFGMQSADWGPLGQNVKAGFTHGASAGGASQDSDRDRRTAFLDYSVAASEDVRF
jgi:hypothetical protein